MSTELSESYIKIAKGILEAHTISVIFGAVACVATLFVVGRSMCDAYKTMQFCRSLRNATSVEYDDESRTLKIVRSKGRAISFRGSVTVWHWLPSCRRCPTFIECILADLFERAEYERAKKAPK